MVTDSLPLVSVTSVTVQGESFVSEHASWNRNSHPKTITSLWEETYFVFGSEGAETTKQ